MSDLRTELFMKVLPKMHSLTKLDFDDPEQPLVPVAPATEEISNNERIFDWIKAHPACYTGTVVKAFEGDIPAVSVTSQVYTLANRGLLHKTRCSTTGKFIYSAAVDFYPRANKAAMLAKMKAGREALGKEEMVRRIQAGHAAKQAEKQPAPTKKKIVLVKKETPAPTVQVTPVDLNTLSIVQARKLYDELKQIFGA
jgi:hypothetical protein